MADTAALDQALKGVRETALRMASAGSRELACKDSDAGRASPH